MIEHVSLGAVHTHTHTHGYFIEIKEGIKDTFICDRLDRLFM